MTKDLLVRKAWDAAAIDERQRELASSASASGTSRARTHRPRLAASRQTTLRLMTRPSTCPRYQPAKGTPGSVKGASTGTPNAAAVSLRDDLVNTARRCREQAETLERCRADLRALIVEADDLGVPVARIAELTGMTPKSKVQLKALEREGRR
jgi:hypothetical protein